MAVTCPICNSTNTQAIVDRWQCLDAGHQFFPDGSFAPSDAFPTAADVPPPPEPEDEPLNPLEPDDEPDDVEPVDDKSLVSTGGGSKKK